MSPLFYLENLSTTTIKIPNPTKATIIFQTSLKIKERYSKKETPVIHENSKTNKLAIIIDTIILFIIIITFYIVPTSFF